jgi:hypothetical protein
MSAKGKFKTQRNKAGVGVTKAVFPSAFWNKFYSASNFLNELILTLVRREIE